MVEAEGFEPSTHGLKVRYSSQLSYASIFLVRPEGLEPPTPYFVDRYSNPLSYGRILKHTMGISLNASLTHSMF